MRSVRPKHLLQVSLLALTVFLSVSSGALWALTSPDTKSTQNEDWPFADGNPESWHYTAQTQINHQTVSQLGLAWSADIPSPSGLVGTPLVLGGIVYQSGPGGAVYANDARTGKLLWQFHAKTPYNLPLSFVAYWAMHHNRGLAGDADRIYVAAGDCRLFAIDRITGKQVWMAEACDPTQPYGIAGPPQVGGGMVFIGNANADLNTSRGTVNAFDAKTGKFLWRFYARPGDPTKPENDTVKMEAKTWGKDYWPSSTGGAQAWNGFTYDPKLGLLYFGTNGPLPYNPLKRGKNPGDELFSSAIVALDARTGKYVWHYTTVPHDAWELSAVATIQIAELPINGTMTRVVMQAPKNGFFYVLDAKTGKFISAGQIAAQNWTKGIDPKTGRPTPNPDAEWWNRPGQDTLQVPGTNGAHTWEPLGYDPRTQLVYIPARNMATLYTKDGSLDWYYPFRKDAKVKAEGFLLAWDPLTQKEKWRVSRTSSHNGGVLATAGDLVFEGTTEGAFEALDSATGRKLWSFQGDGAIMGAPSTAMIDGVEYIFVASGDNGASAQTHSAGAFNTTPNSEGSPRLLAFRLGGTAKIIPKAGYGPVVLPKPWRPRQPADLVALGKQVFQANTCDLCHGVYAMQAGRDIPDLRASSRDTYGAMRLIFNGAFRQAGMPAFKNITDKDIIALQAYLTDQAWNGYEAQQAQQKK
ncbi:outer membrane protein assembly factor BamB family protein [Paraburkholderia dipogonis]|nr:PQQ-binding-like beta-propeller repeat protein [Paraburkholderia dipogonis]